MLGRCFSDDPPDIRVSGVENVVPLQLQEFRGFRYRSKTDPVCVGIKVSWNELCHERRASRCVFRRLDQASTARGDRANERQHCDDPWEVPGTGCEENTNVSQDWTRRVEVTSYQMKRTVPLGALKMVVSHPLRHCSTGGFSGAFHSSSLSAALTAPVMIGPSSGSLASRGCLPKSSLSASSIFA